MRKILGISVLCCEILREMNLIFAGVFSVYYLPLHLCSLAVFFTFYHSLVGGNTVGNFLYCLCMPGAIAALLFPDWTAYPGFSFHCILGFFSHSLLAAYPIMCVAGGDIKPRISRLPACFLILLCLAIPIYGFNVLVHSNYMFLLSPAAGSPLDWFESLLGRPLYILGYIPMIILIWSPLYFPFRR